MAPANAILVFEDLKIPQPEKGKVGGKSLRRRLSLWQRGLIAGYAQSRAEERGLSLTFVDPAYTSQTCSRCGLRGKRKRHRFSCPHCGHEAHADLNAARNIRVTRRKVRSRLAAATFAAAASWRKHAVSRLAIGRSARG
jgi:IS605 OrfB family transposase